MTTLLFFLTLLTEHNLDHTEHFFCNEQANARIYIFYIPSFLFPYQLKKLYSITTGDFVNQFVVKLQHLQLLLYGILRLLPMLSFLLCVECKQEHSYEFR